MKSGWCIQPVVMVCGVRAAPSLVLTQQHDLTLFGNVPHKLTEKMEVTVGSFFKGHCTLVVSYKCVIITNDNSYIRYGEANNIDEFSKLSAF